MVVLTITIGDKRLENLKRATEHITEKDGGGARYWFTSLPRLNAPGADMLTSPVWSRASLDGRFRFTDF
jgi:hypothetical protein